MIITQFEALAIIGFVRHISPLSAQALQAWKAGGKYDQCKTPQNSGLSSFYVSRNMTLTKKFSGLRSYVSTASTAGLVEKISHYPEISNPITSTYSIMVLHPSEMRFLQLKSRAIYIFPV